MNPITHIPLPDETYLCLSHEEANRRAEEFYGKVTGDQTLSATVEDIGFSFALHKESGCLQAVMRLSDILTKEGKRLGVERHDKVLRNLYDIVWITNYIYDVALLKFESDRGRQV
jgi:hypothetical protein